MLKKIGFGTTFMSFLRSLKQNIITSLTTLLKNLFKIKTIYIDIRSTIILVLAKPILLLY